MERFHFEKPKKGDEETEAAEEARNDKLHDGDMFDQDEDAAGERTDLATGERIDNSTYTGMEDLNEIEGANEPNGDDEDITELTKSVKGNPTAEEWLKANKDKL